MAGKKSPLSNRMKFLMQDLIEMSDKGWVTRRKEEKAKTIAQIYKEVAKEEAQAARRSGSSNNMQGRGNNNRDNSSSSLRRSGTGDVRNLQRSGSTSGKSQAKTIVDQDGFVQVSKGMGRPNTSASSYKKSSRKQQGSFAAEHGSTKSSDKKAGKKMQREEPALVPETVAPKKDHVAADECGNKAKGILKEYFVGGDTDEAVLSFAELICAGEDGSVERGAKMMQVGTLMVIEMKEVEVKNFLTVLSKCISDKKMEPKSIAIGLNDPLEFLSDIAVDAPLAAKFLVMIVAEMITAKVLELKFLLDAPEYFRTDGKPAEFASKVVKKLGEEAMKSEANVEVIEKLMSEDDKKTYATAGDLLSA
mmetsp:Transcript_20138/g.36528  ORF Transcript_20138/g.36528 Transcript_20138/m.36528 type:complete len:362 (-) Transcript_20138:226-1311(-)